MNELVYFIHRIILLLSWSSSSSGFCWVPIKNILFVFYIHTQFTVTLFKQYGIIKGSLLYLHFQCAKICYGLPWKLVLPSFFVAFDSWFIKAAVYLYNNIIVAIIVAITIANKESSKQLSSSSSNLATYYFFIACICEQPFLSLGSF